MITLIFSITILKTNQYNIVDTVCHRYCTDTVCLVLFLIEDEREVYELIYIAYTGPSAFIQSDPWDLAIDLWIDTLGALMICFIYDEFTHRTER